MENRSNFQITLADIDTEIYAEPPVDNLGELSHWEMGIRRFCYECNQKVSIAISDQEIQVFLEPDICLIFADLPEKIYALSQGKAIELFFSESSNCIIKLVPHSNLSTNCVFTKFGSKFVQQDFQLDTQQVLETLILFVEQMIKLALTGGYITVTEKEDFLLPIKKIPLLIAV